MRYGFHGRHIYEHREGNTLLITIPEIENRNLLSQIPMNFSDKEVSVKLHEVAHHFPNDILNGKSHLRLPSLTLTPFLSSYRFQVWSIS
jgi:hypothetical protein